MRVTKDGNNIFEIPDTDEDLKTAADKGYVPVVQVSKNGTDWYDIKGTEDEITLAISKGYKTRPLSSKPESYSKAESVFRGGLAGATMGFDDEIGGAIGGAVGAVVNDRSFSDEYTRVRDTMRRQKREAREENPWSYGLSEFAGGMAVPIGAGGAAKTVAGAVGKGALTGALSGGIQAAGDSEDNDEIVGDVAKGVMKGAVFGGAVGGAANVVGRGATKGGRQSLADEWQAFRRGANDGEPITKGMPVVETGERWLKGIKETLKSAGAMEDFRNFISRDKQSYLSRMTDDGTPRSDIEAARPFIDKMSEDEYILLRLTEDGPNEVKKWVADNAASGFGGRFQSEDFQNILNKSTDERQRLRSFNAREAADELAPLAEDASGQFSRASRSRVSELSDEAAMEFDGATDKVHGMFGKLRQSMIDSASDDTIPGNIQKRLDSAFETIESGQGPSFFNLEKGRYYTKASGFEQFQRLQKAREKLDEGIDWDAIRTGKRRMNTGERVLANAREAIDEVLKATPGKREADKVYKAMRELEDAVFANTEFQGRIDKYKMSRLLNDVDRSARFRDNLQALKQWSSDPSFDESARKSAQQFVEKFEKAVADQKGKTELLGFSYKDGPTSAAVGRLGSKLNKNTLLQDAIQSPGTFVNQTDEFMKRVASFTGKTLKDMNPAEKSATINTWVWFNKNIKDGTPPTPEALQRQYQAFLSKRTKS